MSIPENVREYKRVYSEWMESGLSLGEFCQGYNVSETSFRRWGSQIVIYDLEQKPKTSFIELEFGEESCRPTVKTDSSMVVLIGDSIKIKLDDNFDASTFEKAVRILSRLSC